MRMTFGLKFNLEASRQFYRDIAIKERYHFVAKTISLRVIELLKKKGYIEPFPKQLSGNFCA
jgi:hypothetical protein